MALDSAAKARITRHRRKLLRQEATRLSLLMREQADLCTAKVITPQQRDQLIALLGCSSQMINRLLLELRP